MANEAPWINNYYFNPQNVRVSIAQTFRGSDIYFAICAVMTVTTIAVLAASFAKPRSDRIFFYITAGINFVAAIAYFTMGSNLGWVPVIVEWDRLITFGTGPYTRQIFYARYIDWFVTTPLLLMDLLLTAGVPWPTILWTLFVDEIMIVSGLIGALIPSTYKWGYYAFGCVAMSMVFWNLAWTGRKHASALGPDIHRVYLLCGVWTFFIWLLYPVSWGLCEGGNVIWPDSETIFYGVLDLCAKPSSVLCSSAAIGVSIRLVWGCTLGTTKKNS
jgi:bacteriorhodopsin